MKKNKIIKIFIVGTLLLYFSSAYAAEWEFIIRKKGISVYKREDPNSNMFEFKGQGVIKANISKIKK